MEHKEIFSIDNIEENLSNTKWILHSDSNKEAETISTYCPKALIKNVEELIKGCPLSDVTTQVKTGRRVLNINLKEMYEDYYGEVPYIILILSICKEIAGEDGFIWLHNKLQ